MPRLIDDPEYVQGQLSAMKALILGIANLALTRAAFREESLQRLELARTAVLGSRASDAHLQAIDDCEQWVRTLTE